MPIRKKIAPNFEHIDKFRQLGRENWYNFATQKLWIQTKAGLLVPFAQAPDPVSGSIGVNDSQLQIAKIINDYRRNQLPLWLLILKGRQRGISTFVDAVMFGETYNNDNINCLIMAHLADVTTTLQQKMRIFYDKLPDAAKMPYEKLNEKVMAWAWNRSKITSATAGSPSSGHGQTLHRVHLSELSRYPDLPELIKGLPKGIPNLPGVLVVGETTANGADNYHKDMWDEAVSGKSKWVPKFLYWADDSDTVHPFANDREAHDYLEKAFSEYPELAERQKHYGLSAEKIAWYYDRVIETQGDLAYCRQEFPCDPLEAFLASGSPFFPPDITNEFRLLTRPGKLYDPTIPYTSIRDMQEAPDLRRDQDTYIEMWVPPDKQAKYLISCDSAEGIQGRDRSAGYVWDIERMNIVAELHGIIEPYPLKDMLIALAKVYNNAKIAPEAHGPGAALTNALKHSTYHNLYHKRKIVNNVWVVMPDIGWDTNPQTRPIMFTEAKRYFRARRKDASFIPSKKLLDEISTFVISSFTGSGRAMKNRHDDRVMAFAIGIMACLHEQATMPLGIVKAERRSTISDSGPDCNDFVEMYKNPNWNGESYHDFYK